MRAIIEYHGAAAKSYPVIETLVVKGKEDLSIRITDYGGGISNSRLPMVFRYMYTTAPKPTITSDVYTMSTNAPLVTFYYDQLLYIFSYCVIYVCLFFFLRPVMDTVYLLVVYTPAILTVI